MGYELVVIGVSAGGLQALSTLVAGLAPDFTLPIVVVQHRSRDSDALCDVIQECSDIPVHEITDKEPIEERNLYIAPPDYHVLVERGYFSLSVEEPVRFSRPSIDVTFESASDAYGAGVIGVVLTGANHDGARGLRRIVDAGGTAIVQDPATAEVSVMPKGALQHVPTARVAPIEEIGAILLALQGGVAGRAGKR